MNRGDVVEVNWLYSDLSGTEVRPAVVVQADFLNGIIDDRIFVKITGRRFGIPDTEVEFDPALETSPGLTKVCVASCYHLLTRDQTIVGPVIGYLSDAALRKIEACLKKVLELP
jgi:mRNA-degrading endonuclease toxin of MazEF toxin-antitoxin module